MLTARELFLNHIAQTSDAPMLIEPESAEGIFVKDKSGKKFFDMIAGISVGNIGYGNKKVIEAIKLQSEKYLHLMVYGEYIQSPQVQFAQLITQHLPENLDSVYFTNSGTEATEGAMKLAKRFTGRSEIICFNKSYHGSTQGALSLMGDEYFRNSFRPLLPGIRRFDYNDMNAVSAISNQTACVILEPVQAESGVTLPEKKFMIELRKKCKQNGALLIFDEAQTAFGRTGKLFAFQKYEIEPDVLLMAKALGGGLPLGAFISSKEIMQSLTQNPVLGHITSFGGNPVCCAAGMAAMNFLLEEKLIDTISEKEKLFHLLLQHKKIIAVRSSGLLLAIEFENEELCKKVIDECRRNDLITDWFLFAPHCLRLAPPLIISEEEIISACKKILHSIESVSII